MCLQTARAALIPLPQQQTLAAVAFYRSKQVAWAVNDESSSMLCMTHVGERIFKPLSALDVQSHPDLQVSNFTTRCLSGCVMRIVTCWICIMLCSKIMLNWPVHNTREIQRDMKVSKGRIQEQDDMQAGRCSSECAAGCLRLDGMSILLGSESLCQAIRLATVWLL